MSDIKLNLAPNIAEIAAAIAPKINVEQMLEDVSKQSAMEAVQKALGQLKTPAESAMEAVQKALTECDTDQMIGSEFVANIVAGASSEHYTIPDEDDLRREEIAITRAMIVQQEIVHLREALKNGHHEGKLLASYDAELGRLCQVPGVMAALLDNTKV